VPERTPEEAERSAAVDAKRRLVRTGSRGTIVRTGNTGRSMLVQEQDAMITEEDASERLFIRLER
jgi:hypothetical protein